MILENIDAIIKYQDANIKREKIMEEYYNDETIKKTTEIQPQEEVKAVQIPNDIEPRLIPRCEVVKMLGYKTVQGFVNFLKRAPDFPAAIKLSGGFNSRVFYNVQDVIDWINQQSAR